MSMSMFMPTPHCIDSYSLYKVLKLRNRSPPILVFIFKIILCILGLFHLILGSILSQQL